jgi:hypothetical protein
MTNAIFKARVWEVVNVTGTGTVSLTGTTYNGPYQTFGNCVPSGSLVIYSISDGTANTWELGIGTYTTPLPGTLTRTTVLESSSGGALINFAGNSCAVTLESPSPLSSNNGTLPGFAPIVSNSTGIMDESFIRYPAFNFKPNDQLKNVIYGAAQIKLEGTPRRVKVGFLGDSTTAGVSGTTGVENLLKSIASYFAQSLNSLGLNSTYDNTWGCQIYSVTDARVNATGNWAGEGATSAGGNTTNATAAGSYNFIPANPFNAIDVYFITVTDGTVTVTVNGGASLGTITQVNGDGTVQMGTVTCALQSGQVNINWASGSFYLVSIVCYNTLSPAIEVYNFGEGGSSTSGYLSNTGFSSCAGMIASGIELVFIELGINDANSYAVTPATYAANITTIANYFLSVGINVILMMPPPIQAGTQNDLLGTYYPVLQGVALALNVPLFNWYERYGPATTFGSSGLLTSSLHPDAAVYQDKADFLINSIFSASSQSNTIKGYNQSNPATPTAPASTTAYTMQGLKAPMFSNLTGRVLVIISGTIIAPTGTTANNGINFQISYGPCTGAFPTNGSALTGTQVGSVYQYTNPATITAADLHVPFSIQYLITGIPTFILYWVDLAAESVTTASAIGLSNISISITEI